MEEVPIVYGKDINTGAITQLKSIGNVLLTNSGTLDNLTDVVITTPSLGQTLTYDGTNWVNRTKDYLSISVTGTSNPSLYSNTTGYKRIIVNSPAYWLIGTFRVASSGILYDSVTGVISGLNSSKTYFVDVTLNLNSYNIGQTAFWECRVVNNSGTNTYGSVRNTQVNDYSGVSMSIKAQVTGTTTLTFDNRVTDGSSSGISVVGTSNDTNLVIYITEI